MERSGNGSSPESCSRHRRPSESGDADLIECSEVSCRSCAAVLVASCVALGCCPCAAVSMLVLALVKAPWALSRRCLTALVEIKGRRRSSSRRRRVGDEGGGTAKLGAGDDHDLQVDIVGRNKRLEGVLGIMEEEISGRRRASLCTICEAEKMWMEWYQLGHWGFGRVSFSGSLREGHSGKISSGDPQNAPTTLADGGEDSISTGGCSSHQTSKERSIA